MRISSSQLGCSVFRNRHGIRLAYVSGSMFKGVSSKALVIRMGKAGLLGFLGTGGMRLETIESDILAIQAALSNREAYGMNLLASPFNPELEEATVELFLKHRVPRVEAAAFAQITTALVWYRVSGLTRGADGKIQIPHRVLGKVSRPEVAEQFMSPPPEPLLKKLLAQGKITPEEAELAPQIPMADDLCVESDSGGHTDSGVALVLLPVMLRLRDQLSSRFRYTEKLCVGAAGGLGAPEALAAVFVMGADFVLTGSVNQCTVEAGTSDAVKDLLQQAEAQDTDLVPAGDMFEMGAKVQVYKKGLLFPARAKKLYDLYRQLNSLEELDAVTLEQLERRYFKRPLEAVYEETKAYYLKTKPEVIAQAECHPKRKMALIFRWYFIHSSRLALKGEETERVDFQVHCGPALGAFNQWVKGSSLENWRHRHSDDIAERLMNGAAEVLQKSYAKFSG